MVESLSIAGIVKVVFTLWAIFHVQRKAIHERVLDCEFVFINGESNNKQHAHAHTWREGEREREGGRWRDQLKNNSKLLAVV
jgi:hypothetical protein